MPYNYPPYFLTAYGLAVKHGFKGTEEEWLKSLIGQTPQIRIGTVTTVDADQPGAVTINGTAEEPVLNFEIPRGYTDQDYSDRLDALENRPIYPVSV